MTSAPIPEDFPKIFKNFADQLEKLQESNDSTQYNKIVQGLVFIFQTVRKAYYGQQAKRSKAKIINRLQPPSRQLGA